MKLSVMSANVFWRVARASCVLKAVSNFELRFGLVAINGGKSPTSTRRRVSVTGGPRAQRFFLRTSRAQQRVVVGGSTARTILPENCSSCSDIFTFFFREDQFAIFIDQNP
jgi:hypothetical protein